MKTFVYSEPSRNLQILVTDFEDESDPEVALRPLSPDFDGPNVWEPPLQRVK